MESYKNDSSGLATSRGAANPEKNNAASLALKIQWPFARKENLFPELEGMLVGMGCRGHVLVSSKIPPEPESLLAFAGSSIGFRWNN